MDELLSVHTRTLIALNWISEAVQLVSKRCDAGDISRESLTDTLIFYG